MKYEASIAEVHGSPSVSVKINERRLETEIGKCIVRT